VAPRPAPANPAAPEATVRIGDVEVRPLGGGVGCLLMILCSVLASVVATVVLNLLLR
jgi:hypothetical protein